MRTGFDLSKAPLIRLALIRVADDAYYFVWTHHHIVTDGWSAAFDLQEVLEFYQAIVEGIDAPLKRARHIATTSPGSSDRIPVRLQTIGAEGLPVSKRRPR